MVVVHLAVQRLPYLFFLQCRIFQSLVFSNPTVILRDRSDWTCRFNWDDYLCW